METASKGVVRRLTCCCCGGYAGRFQQHWNRDTGYGVCRPCVLKWYKDPEEIASSLGREGVNWANAEQWDEIEASMAGA